MQVFARGVLSAGIIGSAIKRADVLTYLLTYSLPGRLLIVSYFARHVCDGYIIVNGKASRCRERNFWTLSLSKTEERNIYKSICVSACGWNFSLIGKLTWSSGRRPPAARSGSCRSAPGSCTAWMSRNRCQSLASARPAKTIWDIQLEGEIITGIIKLGVQSLDTLIV